jgi:membrane-bound lytic murein transglycosylase D
VHIIPKLIKITTSIFLQYGLLYATIINKIYATNNLALQMQTLNQQKIYTTPDLWQRMREGFALPHQQTKEVQYWEQRYSNPKYFNLIMQNAAPYLYFVISELERRGMPTELALIPIVESTYNPNAISPAAISTGMWQFLASSGKRFGMTLNDSVDERKDIIKSTRGALSYLQYLYDLFNNWELAIAAYNWGEGNINNAIINAASHDFYALEIREVTHQYVPKIIALASIINNPNKFGIKLSSLPNQPYFAIIYPQSPIGLSTFIKQAQLSLDLNKQLNPQYNSIDFMVTPAQHLILPLSHHELYLSATSDNLALTLTESSSRMSNSTLTPLPPLAAQQAISINNTTQENPPPADEIAKFATTKQQLDEVVNDLLSRTNDLKPTAAKPNVTANPGQQAQAKFKLTPATHNKYINYIVMPGDTLYSIAKKFTQSIAVIRADNQLPNNIVHLNQKLLIRS